MRRMTTTNKTREECLKRARELDWMAENSVSRDGAAYAYDQARLWRSLALIALPAGIEGKRPEAVDERG
jgi:hypothetical protein